MPHLSGIRLSSKKENKLNNYFKLIVRIAIALLTIIVLFLSTDFLDNYYSKHYKKSTNNEIKRNNPSNNSNVIPIVNQFSLIIPDLSISVMVAPNVDGRNENVYTEALKNGVAHYKGTALPGSGSNILIFGHSSGVLGSGPYSTIFANLDNLVINEEIVINYNNKTSQYIVTEKKIVKQDDLSILEPTEREQLTLMTCWPIGTNQDRLIIIAKPFK